MGLSGGKYNSHIYAFKDNGKIQKCFIKCAFVSVARNDASGDWVEEHTIVIENERINIERWCEDSDMQKGMHMMHSEIKE
jgi:hypothetical protein